jgi:hypothetical protein
MNRHGRSFAPIILGLVFVLTSAAAARAQESDAPKAEVGVQFTSLSVRPPDFFGTQNQPGFGGRVTYNFTDYFAVEAEANFFPGTDENFPTPSTGGSIQQVQAGVKVGKRYNRFGIFAKARPGFVSHSRAFDIEVLPGPIFNFDEERRTQFSMDVGGVLEFYPSRRTMVRFDFGDTIVRYGERPDFATAGGVINSPSEIKHNFQFSAGVGFRFGGGTGPAEDASADDRFDDERRFEVGAQFSSLTLRIPRRSNIFPGPFDVEETSTEAGFGGRVGYNFTDHVAVEAEGNFYPRLTSSFFGNDTTGGYPAQFQAGVKAGQRFRRFGVFGKARPGLISFSRVLTLVGTDTFNFGGVDFTVGRFENQRQNYFSLDLGGVVEFYHSRRLFTRFDFGDTIIRYPERNQPSFLLSVPFDTAPPETQHNFQFTAGLGLRF